MLRLINFSSKSVSRFEWISFWVNIMVPFKIPVGLSLGTLTLLASLCKSYSLLWGRPRALLVVLSLSGSRSGTPLAFPQAISNNRCYILRQLNHPLLLYIQFGWICSRNPCHLFEHRRSTFCWFLCWLKAFHCGVKNKRS